MTSLDEPLRLPARPAPPARGPLPLLTAVVPVAGALVLWLVTGSTFALWFAALGPLLAVASFLDGRRGARRARRRTDAEGRRELERLRAAVAARHAAEREQRRARHPDVAGYLADESEIWRVVPGRADALTVGLGAAPSAVRIEGEAGDEPSRRLCAEAGAVSDVPVLVPLTAGIAVTGPPLPAAAVARALALQACLALPPGALRIGEEGAPVEGLPHAAATEGLVLHCGEGGRPLPADADAVIVRVEPGTPPPPGCAAVLTVEGDLTARLDHAGASRAVRTEALSAEQAAAIARRLAARAAASLGQRGGRAADLGELLDAGDATGAGGLRAPLGVSGEAAFEIDLVGDGPHAVVVGVTGSGKSELLTTWIVGLCHRYGPERVAFLLVDFKGGRTFDRLERLPHVTGVLTDLDEAEALRAVESLRSEVRRRERVLADVGARDVDEAGDALPRLVVVVDEYAALTSAHPRLHELFGDIAARGRALGMHLVLASQRAAGAFRDAVLANAPLRIGLRVTDASDSRAVLGTDAAAQLSGRPEARGVALVRRTADAAPRAVRVPRCTADVIARAAARHPGERAHRPWLPPLPERLPLAAVARAGAIVVGLIDEPEHQRQRPWELADEASGLLVAGRSASGKTEALRTIARQASSALWIPADVEAAWDAIVGLEHVPPGTVVVFDDADAVLARMDAEHAAHAAEHLMRCVREARGRGIRIVLSCVRTGGALARVCDLFSERLILAQATRADHVAAGGAGDAHDAHLPPGRGFVRGRLVQVAETAPAEDPVPPAEPAPWRPGRRPVALVAPRGPATERVVDDWRAAGVVARRVDAPDADVADGVVLYGSPEEWLGQWRLLSRARAEGDLVVDAACAAEHRAITGSRDLPPLVVAGARRAWLHRTGATRVRRIRLPG
ncbi:FtsK/SpoIIIE domain-containing protein [Microbacterium sp. No. 7]|uniref:FtsK/SpoIIIE domain-containing protein n=1 Tax=Microbacterium sp. No. 7 TaxID=1714373 RepID=UPI0006D05E02|nr:FtsK/SpoIIIE domain-containing protein [Microbacterium sp. No. 7]ALJ21155.1 hypothetical protein AOA12_15090 [Microbacterium sp. No. 7]